MVNHCPFVALCACLAVAPARAETANIAGSGGLLCAEFLARFAEPPYRIAFAQWVLGFMSGATMVMTQTLEAYRDLDGMNSDVVIGSLRASCAEAPADTMRMAVEKLFASRPVRTWPKPQ